MTGRVLITGAQGYVGRHLVAEWLEGEGDVEIVGVGRSPRSDASYTHHVHRGRARLLAPLTDDLRRAARDPRYRYVSLDLHDRPALTRLIQEVRPDVVVNLAAALRDEDPDRLFQTNVGAVVALIEAIAGAGVAAPRLVLGSSGGIYGRPLDGARPIPEDAPCNPVDVHSVSKLAGEQVARILTARHGIPAVWARIFNPVGPGQDERHLCGMLAAQAVAVAAGALPPTIEVGPLNTTRDFVDGRDVAAALRILAARGCPGEAYNIGSGEEHPTARVFREVLRLAGIDDRVAIVARAGRPADIPRHYADIAKLRALGYAPRHSLESSLDALVRYYRETVAAAAEVAELRFSTTPPGDEPEPREEVLEVRATQSHAYPVQIASGLLDRLPARLQAMFAEASMVVLTDQTVHGLYGERFVGALRSRGVAASEVVVPDGEASKSLQRCEEVIAALHERRFDRRAVLVNLGGGTITDLGGFVASAYLRGVAYVNVPTTLLAQHDSAIGAKVAVNTPWAKNFVGAFHHPRAVFCDPAVLSTLAPRDVAAGVAEAGKVALCGDAALFELLERSVDAVMGARDTRVLAEVVRRAAARKIALLAPDPYEVDLRRVLNLGHTFGHALETEMAYVGLLHGEAVAFGIAVAATVAHAREVLPTVDAERILALLAAYGLPPPVPRARLRAACQRMEEIRLVRGRVLNFVLPVRVGVVTIVPEVSDAEILAALDRLAAHPTLRRCVAD